MFTIMKNIPNTEKIIKKHNRQARRQMAKLLHAEQNRKPTRDERKWAHSTELGTKAAGLLVDSAMAEVASKRAADLGYDDRAFELKRKADRLGDRALVWENLSQASMPGGKFRRERKHRGVPAKREIKPMSRAEKLVVGTVGVTAAAGALGFALGKIADQWETEVPAAPMPPAHAEPSSDYLHNELPPLPSDLTMGVGSESSEVTFDPDLVNYDHKGPDPRG